MRIGLMIEGQDGLTWDRWQRLLQAAEQLGFDSVFRSDHFVNPSPPDKPALQLWPSLAYAASHTSRIEFGPLVTPVTFNFPAITAKTAAAVHDLSGGRLVLGIGAGWNQREHTMFGIPFPPTAVRFEMLHDYLEIVTRLMRSDQPVSYQGTRFQLDGAILLPRPDPPGGPALLVGGNGPQRTLPLAARYADEWNAVFVPADDYRRLQERFDQLLDEAGRPRDAVRRSVMLGTVLARDERSLQEKLAARGRTAEELRQRGLIVGTPAMWIEQLTAYDEAGAQRVMLQWLDQDDVGGIETVAREVLPAVQSG